MKNPKVLFITLEFGENISGGIARVVNGITLNFQNQIDLDIVLFKFEYGRTWVSLYRHKNNRWSKKSYIQNFINAIRKIVNHGRYDVIHIFHIDMAVKQAMELIKKEFDPIKIVYSCHSIAKQELEVRKLPAHHLEIESYFLTHADHIHLLNNTSQQYIKELYPSLINDLSYTIIANGIEELDFKTVSIPFQNKLKKSNLKEGSIKVLCMSRWSWGKGLDILLDAIPEVVKRNSNIQFVLAGRKKTSWEEAHQDFLNYIDEKILPVKDYVTTLGWLNDTQRNALFKMVDIWVMPSQIEYFPYSLLEPMISHLPIITSNIECAHEILEDRKDGLFFDQKNSKALSEQILTLVNNSELRKELADNAYKKAKDLYKWNVISQQYLRMYIEVMKSGKSNGFPIVM